VNGLAPWLSPHADRLVALARGRVQVTSTFRSYSDQLRLWNNRRHNPYPVAPPGSSWHEYGRAFDIVGDRELLMQLGQIWRSWGGTWSAKDVIHFQA
jgi:hypothetical protein